MSDNYLVATIKAFAMIDGQLYNDVVSVSATFALNTIPTASVVVAVGFTGKGGGRANSGIASIHTLKNLIRPRARASVYVEIKDVLGEQIGITPGNYLVFEGYVAGVSYQRSNNHANYSINLIHWLDDLNNSSAINGNWFPGVPHDWAQQAVFNLEQSNTNTGVLVPRVSRGIANSVNAKQDLWEKLIKPLMTKIAGFSGGAVQGVAPPEGGAWASNKAAEDALKKMPGNSPNYVPLTLQIDGGMDTTTDLSIAEFFTRGIGDSFAQNTFWAKLVDFAGQFLFAISPAVEWATPIPFCAGLKFGGSAKTITAREYSYANLNANMSQLLEGIYVYHPVASATGVPANPTPQNLRLSHYKVWGRYPKNPQKGLKLFKNPPGWLGNLNPAAASAYNSATNVNDGGPPRSGAGQRELPPGVSQTATAHLTQNKTVENFAKHWYFTEILQQRYGEIAGPLRFDIAPGSIIKIETPLMEKELGGGNETPFMIASVVSVSYVINSERATAGTSFSIAHMKTEKENDDTELYSTEKAPMYDQAWYGGPLTVPFGANP